MSCQCKSGWFDTKKLRKGSDLRPDSARFNHYVDQKQPSAVLFWNWNGELRTVQAAKELLKGEMFQC